jgi:phosphoglycolate phosphatase
MTFPARPTLVFDLDGTLVDTAPDLFAALNVALAAGGLRSVGAAEARTMIGHGARALVERGIAANRADLAPEEVDRLFQVFLDHYAAHIADESRPFPGLIEAMDRFEAAGWRLAVCTNKLEFLSRLLVDTLGLGPRFAALTGGDTFAFKKPDARHLLETIARAGGDPRRAVMVGDSATDIDTAKNAGVPVVAVDFGYTPIHVSELGPDRVISHYDALWDAVAELGVGKAAAARTLP